ncbi:hypothetical protein PRZ48_013564 [Zasmidium cellare]|uniref:Alpha/beta hydrolase fold-3 domain-containing protein n=1 Tax=Zasmidium cellare TaxID=395010 RepID=A0ABR0E1S4_ZASCE|nr:hypothetical protein PRZ48_013564 [Zasmidium cellare]
MPGEYAQSWLDWESASGGRQILHGTADQIKAMYTATVQALTPLLPKFSENVDVQEGTVEGTKYRTYTPKGETGPFPIAIWTHGGGWMTGDLDSDHLLCGVIAENTKSAVVNVDYRLTPEFKWPAQLDDGLKLYKWAHTNASTFHGDPSKIYTIGGSAGGGLALSIANAVLQDPALKSSLKGIVAIVPATAHWETVPQKYKDKYHSYKENEKGTPIIDKESMEIFYNHLGADPHDPSAFPILAEENHKNFPPTYFASCEFDPLRDDATIMEIALKEAGVKTKHDTYKGLPHYFWIIPSVPEGQAFVGNLIGGIEWIKAQM